MNKKGESAEKKHLELHHDEIIKKTGFNE